MEAPEQGSPPKAGFPASHYIKMEATKAVWVQNYTYLIYKAEIVCVCVCVRDTRAHFLLRRPRCGCWGHCGSGYSGVVVARLAVRKELSFHFRFFLRGRLPFSNYCSHRLLSLTRLDSPFRTVTVTWLLRALGDRRRAP